MILLAHLKIKFNIYDIDLDDFIGTFNNKVLHLWHRS